jgi:hypothetical protein
MSAITFRVGFIIMALCDRGQVDWPAKHCATVYQYMSIGYSWARC